MMDEQKTHGTALVYLLDKIISKQISILSEWTQTNKQQTNKQTNTGVTVRKWCNCTLGLGLNSRPGCLSN